MHSLRRALSRLNNQPYLLLVLATLCWGGNAVAGRLAVGDVSPMALTALRWIIVVVLLGLFARRQIAAEWPRVLPHWRMLLIMGSVGFTGFNALFYAAAHHTSAVNLGIIQGTMPVLVMIGSLLVYGTPVRIVQMAGMAITLAGVAMVASRGELAVLTSLGFNIGDVWMLIASVGYAGYTVALRRRPPLSATAFFSGLALAALLTSLPLVTYEAWTGQLKMPSLFGWLVIAYVAVLPSLLSQLMFVRGVELIGPSRAGLFINLVPVFAALLGVIILGETFALYHAVGLALVLGGIWLAERGKAEAPGGA